MINACHYYRTLSMLLHSSMVFRIPSEKVYWGFQPVSAVRAEISASRYIG